MESVHAREFQKETSKLFEIISSSLTNLNTESIDNSFSQQHFLYWHEVKSLASLFALDDIAAVSHEIESLFDSVNNNRISLSQIDTSYLTEAIEFIKASLNKSIHNQPHTLDLENLLNKIHRIAAPATHNVTPTSSEVEHTNNQSAIRQNQPRKILIIEDEPVNLTLLETNIKNFNNSFEVIKAQSAEEGLFHFFTNTFDLIFLDIMMPVIDGNDFIAIVEKNIEKKNICNRCNIVVQTAIQSITQLTGLAKKECVQEIIRKPISPSRINECLVRYCIAPYE